MLIKGITNNKYLVLFISLFILSFAVTAHTAWKSSDNYTIKSDVVSAGGGNSISDNYSLEHTTGQASAIGESSSDNYINNAGFWNTVGELDTDGDGIADGYDNCLQTPNPGQEDTDGDGYGNICDSDLDNDLFVGPLDFNMFVTAWGTRPGDANWSADADFDSDGFVGPLDFNMFVSRWWTREPWD